jgi:phosphate ABC transporter phosphate-binding protein
MMFRACSILLLAVMLLSGGGCTKTDALTGAGATFIYPMMSKWAHEYEKAKGIKINYQSIGSGGGIQQMTAQTVAFGCSDGPMNEEQLKKAKEVNGDVVHIPLAMGADVPAYNLESVKELKFSGPVLADIYLGKIKKWNDSALQKLNPDASLPDKEIVVVHRSDGSGTTYIWVDYLSKVSDEWKTKVGVGTSVNWPTGVGQKGNEGVAGLVKRTPGSIGYIELIYALQNKIQFGSVQNKEGAFVVASMESVTAAANAALTDIPEDLRYSITDALGKDSYPVSGTTWAITYTNNPGGKGKEVRDFLHWCTHDGQQLCEALHYSRLPKGLVERVEKRLDLIK